MITRAMAQKPPRSTKAPRRRQVKGIDESSEEEEEGQIKSLGNEEGCKTLTRFNLDDDEETDEDEAPLHKKRKIERLTEPIAAKPLAAKTLSGNIKSIQGGSSSNNPKENS